MSKSANKKPIFKKWWFWVIIIVVIGGAAGAGASSSNEPKKVDDTGNTTASSVVASSKTEETSFTIGDMADFDGIKVKLSSAILSNGDGNYIKPDSGKKFLCLIFDMTNDSKTDINVSSLASFEAYCDDYSLNIDIMGQQSKEVDGLDSLDGTVAAGKRMNGVICYQVPEGFKKFDITFKPSFWGDKKVTFTFTGDKVDRSGL